ncbi:Metallo-hydrolase/oxidoreductase [Lichtheimia hyalospora FSU 10163]|nr:Metallo-hydrolase/oxidoreductase [Lichtheimia hyalospora FSU 10163]
MPNLVVYGADTRIPEINHICKDEEAFLVGSLYVTALHTPCHTKGDACYYVFDPSTHERVLFTGDVLLVGGVGKSEELDVRNMYDVLFRVMANLSDSTLIYCGHENTASNLNFALTIEPDNEHLQAKLRWCQQRTMTIPSTLGQEKQYNPFMRVHEYALQVATQCHDPLDVLTRLCEWKE